MLVARLHGFGEERGAGMAGAQLWWGGSAGAVGAQRSCGGTAAQVWWEHSTLGALQDP